MTPPSSREPGSDVVRVLQVASIDAGPRKAREVIRAIGESSGVLQDALTVGPWGGPRAALRIARLAPGRDVVHAHGGRALRWCRIGLALSGSVACLESTQLTTRAGAVAAEASEAVTSYRAAVRSRRLRIEYRSRLARRGRVRRALPIRST